MTFSLTVPDIAISPAIATNALESVMGYSFKNRAYLEMSLVHKSYSRELNNERLEFLGDAVLDLAMSDVLMRNFPEDAEGDLTKKRAALVNEITLNEIAQNLELQSYIQLGKAEQDSGLNMNSRLLSSCLEALLGAIYIDSGYQEAYAVVDKLFLGRIHAIKSGIPFFEDYKTQLQEFIQKKYHITPEYQLVNTAGPEHQKIFEIEVLIQGKTVAKAEGRSKKMAEQNAAKKALEVIHEL